MSANQKHVHGIDHASLMDRVYRHQRYFYDATRKYYLLGRDTMIAGLNVPEGGSVLEIGCGTGRNLIKTAKTYPSAKLYGIDISAEMLETAQAAAKRAGIEERTKLERADATHFNPVTLFNLDRFDRIFISYAISMIPQWQSVIEETIRHLKPDGELHIVDFGNQQGLPRWFKKALFTWLNWFHVTPREDLTEICQLIANLNKSTVKKYSVRRDFSQLIVLERNSN